MTPDGEGPRAAERKTPVRVLTKRDLPGMFLNSPNVEAVEPCGQRSQADAREMQAAIRKRWKTLVYPPDK